MINANQNLFCRARNAHLRKYLIFSSIRFVVGFFCAVFFYVYFVLSKPMMLLELPVPSSAKAIPDGGHHLWKCKLAMWHFFEFSSHRNALIWLKLSLITVEHVWNAIDWCCHHSHISYFISFFLRENLSNAHAHNEINGIFHLDWCNVASKSKYMQWNRYSNHKELMFLRKARSRGA